MSSNFERGTDTCYVSVEKYFLLLAMHIVYILLFLSLRLNFTIDKKNNKFNIFSQRKHYNLKSVNLYFNILEFSDTSKDPISHKMV